MATTNQTFWPDYLYTAHDQAYGTDIDKMNLALPGAGNTSTTTINGYGTSGNKDITFDPNTTNSTSGINDALGFAIDNADMGSVSTARRKILSGSWVITFEALSSALALNVVTMNARIYKVAASPSFARTQIGSGSVSLGLLAASRTSFTLTVSGVAEQILEAGETIQLTMYANATGQGVSSFLVTLIIGDGAALSSPLDFKISTPAPGIRFDYPTSDTATGKGTITKNVFDLPITRSLVGKGTATSTKATIASKSFDLVGKGTVTKTMAIAEDFDLIGKGKILTEGSGASTITIPIDEVPSGGATSSGGSYTFVG